MWQELAERTFGAAVYDPGIRGEGVDPRWASVEGSDAWIRQCLSAAPDSGTVGVLMPAAAAAGAPARTLRRALLRGGVLRAIVAGPDEGALWLLEEPRGDRPQYLLLIDAAGEPATVGSVWRAFRSDPAHPEAARFAVRIVDRLDEHVDLRPVRAGSTGPHDYTALRAEYLARPAALPPMLAADEGTWGTVTLGELVEAGMVGFHRSPPTIGTGTGGTPMLTAKDVRLARPPSRYGSTDIAGAVLVRSGDIAVVRSDIAVEVCTDDGALLGPGIDLLRADAEKLDPHFLAGVVLAALHNAPHGDIDLYQVAVPRLPLPEQRRYAAAFTALRTLEAGRRRQRTEIEQLVRLGYRGLATGRLRPAGPGE